MENVSTETITIDVNWKCPPTQDGRDYRLHKAHEKAKMISSLLTDGFGGSVAKPTLTDQGWIVEVQHTYKEVAIK